MTNSTRFATKVVFGRDADDTVYGSAEPNRNSRNNK